jgi:outer membrane receptor protein involved in Fe transport
LGNEGLRVDLELRNALDKKYANFLSRYKTYALDPGRNLTLRLSTGF